jgi:aromatic-L-amino-acid decarboxylase
MTPKLSFTDAELARAGELLVQFMRQYERSLPGERVFPELDREALTQLLHRPFPAQGRGIDAVFRDIHERILPHSTRIAHPRFLAYVQGPPNGIAPFAEAIAATLNQNCNFWQLSPAGSVVERKVVAWLCGLFDLPRNAGGIVTSGGSAANLIALAAATNRKLPGFRAQGLQGQPKPLTLYTSTEAHRCVEKSAVILGIGQSNIRKIPVGKDFRIRMDLLEEAVRHDKHTGKLPFCVVATSGTINTGAVDPIEEIAALCRREDMWLHVDGAYGALFVLADRPPPGLEACGLADSIAVDPHKMLFAPLEAGCLIVREPEELRRAFNFSSSYLTVDDDPLFTNYLEYGPQLSRSFKAFKLWCALEVFGTDAFRQAANHTLEIADYMATRIQASRTLELMAPTPLTAVCFRVRNASDQVNQSLLAQTVGSGTALLGPVNVSGRAGLRACITNFRTTRDDIDLLIDWLERRSSQLLGERAQSAM